MSRFNSKTSKDKVSLKNSKVKNLAGGYAVAKEDKLALVSILLTSMVKDQFYRKGSDAVSEVIDLIDRIEDKEFVAKAAVYARNAFGMRSISHIVAGELVHRCSGSSWLKDFVDSVVFRPDDMTEILSYYFSKYSTVKTNKKGRAVHRAIPNSLKKGFAKAFLRFDDYRLAKYRGEGKDVSLVDIVNLCNFTYTGSVKKLVDGVLKSEKTWESKLSKAGQASDEDEKANAKSLAWRELVLEGEIGQFALLRNLRNIIEQAPEVIDAGISLLTEEKRVLNSKILPFRYQTALNEVSEMSSSNTSIRKVIKALNKALDISCSNVPVFDGETCICVDVSGSMTWSGSSSDSLLNKATVFASILAKSNNADIILFSSDAKYVNINTDDSTLTIAEKLKKMADGGGTNFSSIFKKMNKKYGNIVILSDEQGWLERGYTRCQELFESYMAKHAIRPNLYSVDLSGSSTTQFSGDNVLCLSGLSEKIFDIMKLLSQDKDALIDLIDNVKLKREPKKSNKGKNSDTGFSNILKKDSSLVVLFDKKNNELDQENTKISLKLS